MFKQGAPAYGLTEISCETWAGWVWFNLNPDAEPLRDFLNVLPAHRALGLREHLNVGPAHQFDPLSCGFADQQMFLCGENRSYVFGEAVRLVEAPTKNANSRRGAEQCVEDRRDGGHQRLSSPAVRPDQQVLLGEEARRQVVQRRIVVRTDAPSRNAQGEVLLDEAGEFLGRSRPTDLDRVRSARPVGGQPTPRCRRPKRFLLSDQVRHVVYSLPRRLGRWTSRIAPMSASARVRFFPRKLRSV